MSAEKLPATGATVAALQAENADLRARLAAVEVLPDEWKGEADANETHPKESRTLLSAAAELRAAIAAWDE